MIHNILQSTWQSTPPTTKYMSILLFTLTLLVHLHILSPFTLTFSLHFIKHGEIWRLLTSFFYFGSFNIETLLHIIFFFRYSKMLEEGFILTSDYLFLIIYCCTLIIFLSILFKLSVLSTILSSAITYIWTRRNRSTQVQLLGCIIFPAFYLPFVVPTFSVFSEHKVPFDEVLGILVGQSYFYLKYVVRKYGVEVLCTPWIIKRMCGEVFEKEKVEMSVEESVLGRMLERELDLKEQESKEDLKGREKEIESKEEKEKEIESKAEKEKEKEVEIQANHTEEIQDEIQEIQEIQEEKQADQLENQLEENKEQINQKKIEKHNHHTEDDFFSISDDVE